jgi:hypothetical protein
MMAQMVNCLAILSNGNWLQTFPGKSWWLALRMYGPLEP